MRALAIKARGAVVKSSIMTSFSNSLKRFYCWGLFENGRVMWKLFKSWGNSAKEHENVSFAVLLCSDLLFKACYLRCHRKRRHSDLIDLFPWVQTCVKLTRKWADKSYSNPLQLPWPDCRYPAHVLSSAGSNPRRGSKFLRSRIYITWLSSSLACRPNFDS